MHLKSRRREICFDVASTSPKFIALDYTPRQVVPIYYPGSGERIQIWFRRSKRRQNLQVMLLTLVFGFAGGVTGGILGAVNRHLAQDEQTSFESEERTQNLVPPEDATEVMRVPASPFRVRRRSFARPRPRARLIAEFGSFDLKQGKKANHVNDDEDN